MNYSQARQIKDENGNGTGKWHWTTMNDGHIRPDGYCSRWETCPDCKGYSGIMAFDPNKHCATCADKGIIIRADPCPGHDTPEGAAEHYRQYLLDNLAFDDIAMQNRQEKCRICGVWTQGVARTRESINQVWVLCDEHRNRESVDRLLEAPGYVMSS
jgi:hypothetical protein